MKPEIVVTTEEIAVAQHIVNKRRQYNRPLTWWQRLWCRHEQGRIQLSVTCRVNGVLGNTEECYACMCIRCDKRIAYLEKEIVDEIINQRL